VRLKIWPRLRDHRLVWRRYPTSGGSNGPIEEYGGSNCVVPDTDNDVSALCGTAVLAIYASGGRVRASAKPAFTPSIGLVADKTASGVRRRLLESDDLSGFTPGSVATYSSAKQWVSSPNDQQSATQTAAEKTMLIREGFKAGAAEQLTNDSTGEQGLSTFEQFRSATAARSALAYYISNLRKPAVQATDGAYKSFKVSGIPGAVGYTLGGTTGGGDISFADGDYYYLLGREGATSGDVAGLNTAARHLYGRVHR
jgi:hypothetical protein